MKVLFVKRCPLVVTLSQDEFRGEAFVYKTQFEIDSIHRVDFETSGSQAIQLTKQISYDLIVMDIDLPDRSGFDIVYQIKQDTESINYEAVIVGFTEDSDEEVKTRGMKMGMTAVYPGSLELSWLLWFCRTHTDLCKKYRIKI